MLNRTMRSSRSGICSIAPSPIAPPQSWATSVTRRRSSFSTSVRRFAMWSSKVSKSLRLVAQATPDVINRNAAVMAAKRRDQPPPVERPGGVTVNEQQRFR